MGGDGLSGLAFEVLDPAPVGVAVSRGADHRLIYTNARYRSLFGDLPLGVPLEEVLGDLAREEHILLFDRVRKTGEPAVVTETIGGPALVTPAGQQRFFTFSLSRVSFHDGALGVLLICLEVTDQVGAARRIQAIADERSRILRRYTSLVRVMAEMTWVLGADGGITEPIPEWERVTGQTWQEYRGDGWLRAVHPDDREQVTRSWARARREVQESWEQVYRLRTADAGYRHYVTRAVPVVEDGRVLEWVGTSTDVEERWQRERRRRLALRAAEAVAGRLSIEESLAALAHVIVPELADGCGVHLVTDLAAGLTGEPSLVVERVAAAAGPGLPRMPRFSAQRLTVREGAFVEAVRKSRPVLRTFPPGSPPGDIGPTGTRGWLRASRGNSIAILPVTVDGAVTAVITAATCGDRPSIGQDDLDLLSRTFEQAHDRLRDVLRYQRARQIAYAMQQSLLAEPPDVPGLEITARYRPSPAAAEVGGDWYDSFVLADGETVLAIGDVAGHDLRAAVAMGRLRNMLRGLAVDRREPPGEILRRLDDATQLLYGEETATCVLARVERREDGHELYYSVAGHPPPLLVTEAGEGRFLDAAANPMLGLPYAGPFASAREPLPPRSTLLLYTDGLVERPDEDLDDSLARLCDQAAEHARAPLEEFCDRLLSVTPSALADDVAVIALRVS